MKIKRILPLLAVGAVAVSHAWASSYQAATYDSGNNTFNSVITAGKYFAFNYQLDNPPDTLVTFGNALSPSLPDISQVLLYDPATSSFNVYTYDTTDPDGLGPGAPDWYLADDYTPAPTVSLRPGTGVFLITAGSIPALTVSGTALTTPLNLAINPTLHYYFLGSQVYNTGTPAGPYSFYDITGQQPTAMPDNFALYRFKNNFVTSSSLYPDPTLDPSQYTVYQWNASSSTWSPSTPTVNLSEAVWIGPSQSALITGTVYQGTVCSSPTVLQNWSVEAQNTTTAVNYFGVSDVNGNYTITVPPGTYTVSSYSPPAAWTQVCPLGPPTYTVVAAAGTTYGGNNFTEKFTAAAKDLAVDMVSLFPYPLRSPCAGQNMTYEITYRNDGAAVTPKVTLYFPATQTFVSQNIASAPGFLAAVPTAAPAGFSGVLWTHTGTIAAKASGNIEYTVTLPSTPTSGSILPLGTVAKISFTPGVDAHPADNQSTLNQTITCSYDPNDLQVDPQGCGPEGYIPAGQPLTYLIKFQNTGNAAASEVVVSNLLDATLDPTTVQVLGSSQPNVFQVQGDQLVWTFPNINLPLQSVDDTGSQGYVKYQVSPLASDPVGAVITNIAAIYFDLNAPIYTVITTNTLTASAEPVASFSVTTAVGSAGQTNSYTYTGGTAGATYVWNFGPDATPSTSTDQNPAGVVFSSQGDQMVTLEVSLGDCQSDPAAEIVTVGVPTLNAQVDDGQLDLTWTGNGYHLQERGDLQPATAWTATTATVTQVNSDCWTTLPLDSTVKYYRLSQVAP